MSMACMSLFWLHDGRERGIKLDYLLPTLLKLLTRIPTVFDTQIRTIEERIAMVCALEKDRVL